MCRMVRAAEYERVAGTPPQEPDAMCVPASDEMHEFNDPTGKYKLVMQGAPMHLPLPHSLHPFPALLVAQVLSETPCKPS